MVAEAAAATQPDIEYGAVLGHGPTVSHDDAGRTLVELVDRRAAQVPDSVCCRTDDTSLTLREMSERADRLAAPLRAAGVGRGSVVGVCAERSPAMVHAILAVVRAGAAYLPLDPSLPTARLRFMIDEAGARVVLTQRSTMAAARAAGARLLLDVDAQPPAADAVRPSDPARPDDPAYVLYTSGSTGQPKGVVVSHRAIVNRLLWMQDRFDLTSSDRVLLKTPYGFDVSVWEIFWPLVTGATTVIARPGGHQDAEYLAAVIRRHGVTTAHFVPSMLSLFLDEPAAAAIPGLRRVVCSGEALPPTLVRRFREQLPDTQLHNLYGPTEAAVDVTAWDCRTAGDVVPIGEPVANTQAIVLDDRLQPVADLVPGELYLGGVQLAHAYARRPALTASRFVAHPAAGSGGRLYRTGDRVRRLPDRAGRDRAAPPRGRNAARGGSRHRRMR
jgi:amino acid adenylation domain-containing protein